jgi:hypothetical protein
MKQAVSFQQAFPPEFTKLENAAERARAPLM